MGNEIAAVSFDQMVRLAQSMVKSNLFGVKDVDQAIALMSIAVAEGKHPATIARDFDIIQGRQAKKSEAMLRDLIAGGGAVEWHQLDDTKADATFSHPQGGTVRISWDMARAEQAGLRSKEMYRKYPRQMLRARVVSEGCRTVAPLSTSGMYTPEEVNDIVDVTPRPEHPGPPVQEPVSITHQPTSNAIDWLAVINDCGADDLKAKYHEAYRALWDIDDIAGLKLVKAAYDARQNKAAA